MLERGGKRKKGQNLPGVDEGGPAGVLRAEWKGCSGQVAFWSTEPLTHLLAPQAGPS